MSAHRFDWRLQDERPHVRPDGLRYFVPAGPALVTLTQRQKAIIGFFLHPQPLREPHPILLPDLLRQHLIFASVLTRSARSLTEAAATGAALLPAGCCAANTTSRWTAADGPARHHRSSPRQRACWSTASTPDCWGGATGLTMMVADCSFWLAFLPEHPTDFRHIIHIWLVFAVRAFNWFRRRRTIVS